MQHLSINITKGNIITAEAIRLKTEWEEINLSELIELTETTDHRTILAILSGRDREFFGVLTDDVIGGLISFCWKIQMVVPKSEVPKYFEFKDKYYFVSELVDNREWAAYENCRKAIAENQAMPLRSAAMVLAIYCRPKGEVYDHDKALQRAELFKELPAPLAYSLCAFFLTRYKSLWQISQSLERQSTRRKKLKRAWKIWVRGAFTLRWIVCRAGVR